LTSNIKFIFESDTYLLSQSEIEMSTKNKKVEVGHLYTIGHRLCLVIKVAEKNAAQVKRVLIQWVGEEEHYWVSYDLFASMIKDE